MDKIDNVELLTKTTELLNIALDMTGRREDPQLLLIDVLGPLQLHMQRSSLLSLQADPTPNALGWSPEQIEDAIKLIDDWLARLTGDNIIEEYEAAETLRMYYSPYRLMLYLQSLEQSRRSPEN